MTICNSTYAYIIISEGNNKRIDFTMIFFFSLCRYFLPFGAAVKTLQF